MRRLHLLLHRKTGKLKSPPPSSHLYPLGAFTRRSIQTLTSLDKSQMTNETPPTCPSCSSGHLHAVKILPSTVIAEQGRQEKRHRPKTLGSVSMTLLQERGAALVACLCELAASTGQIHINCYFISTSFPRKKPPPHPAEGLSPGLPPSTSR